MTAAYEALARTTLLLDEELFAGEADHRAIADGLRTTTVRLAADEEALSCRAGQTALVTAFMLTARLGIGVELSMPNVAVIDRVAPLRLERLEDALVELGGDLIPDARIGTTAGDVDECFAFGGGGARDPGAAIGVAASDTEARLERGSPGACRGDLPFGGFAAGAAATAIALEAAIPRLEAATGLRARQPRPSPGPPVRIDLEELFPGLSGARSVDLGAADVISGGAITHALVYCLLRMPDLEARFRVVEADRCDRSNLNRYALLRASQEDRRKIDQLEAAATASLEIAGVDSLFTPHTRAKLAPLAERVLVGVDDVEARWWVQRENPGWLAVGATDNQRAQLTAHTPGIPCAACLHPEPLPEGTLIPTISFVSFWAGLMQVCATLTPDAGPRNITVYPFALGAGAPITAVTPVANPGCPIGCSASAATATASTRPATTEDAPLEP